MLSLFDLVAALLTTTAAFAWLNYHVPWLPPNVGLLVMGLAFSLLMMALELFFPDNALYRRLAQLIGQVDFYETVMHGMLAFLLFAGALHVNVDWLRRRAPMISILATAGVLISALLVAAGLWSICLLLGQPLAFPWAFVFGALIAPTDPVAVLGLLKTVRVPKVLATDMSCEALLNDGIAVVLFTTAVSIATASDAGPFTLSHTARLLLLEPAGGAVLGLATGYIAYHAIKPIDDYTIEIMISLALVTATYALAGQLHVSGPIAVVIAGVLIGNRGASHAMSDHTKRYLFGFWKLIDEILNAMLFLLIGLEALVLGFHPRVAWIGLIAIPLVTIARFFAVGVPVALLNRWQRFAPGTVLILTWAAARGGISVALALSLPANDLQNLIIAATYSVVLFSVIVQGLTLPRLARMTFRDGPDAG